MRGHDNVGGRGELWLDEKFKESEKMVGWGGIKSLRKEWEGKVLEKRETREKGRCRYVQVSKNKIKKSFSKEEKRTIVKKDMNPFIIIIFFKLWILMLSMGILPF